MRPLLPALSRTHKANEYLSCKDTLLKEGTTCSKEGLTELRKRKRPTSEDIDDDDTCSSAPSCCFEVRKCTCGIGMYATRNIECGSIIIDREDPIVSTHRNTTSCDYYSNGKRFCHHCVTPLGSLRDHLNFLTTGNDDGLLLNHLLGDNDGLQFTAKEPLLECNDCQQVAWCSQQCADAGQTRHRLLCRREFDTKKQSRAQKTPLQAFYNSVDNPSIFQLAVDGISAILTAAEVEFGKKNINTKDHQKWDALTDTTILHFWEDYGSHPLWWEVGNPAKFEERKSQCREFTKLLLRDVFILSPSLQSSDIANLMEPILAKICNLDNIGKLLGMLQCNVMEFEFLSPLEQYWNHLWQDIEDEVDEEEGQEDDKESKAATRKWFQQHASNDNLQEDIQVRGSGLYPLLTLANHNCDPNASIDFLQESNQGSMIALRDIRKGDEICITYVPNGDLDAGSTPERFRHFEPTRTWKWLNRNQTDVEREGNDSGDSEGGGYDSGYSDEMDGSEELSRLQSREDGLAEELVDADPQPSEEEDGDDEADEAEGSDPTHRAELLLEYGFVCRCQRCLHENSCPTTPYERVTGQPLS